MQIYNGGRIKKNCRKISIDLDAFFLDTEKTKNDISVQVTILSTGIIKQRK